MPQVFLDVEYVENEVKAKGLSHEFVASRLNIATDEILSVDDIETLLSASDEVIWLTTRQALQLGELINRPISELLSLDINDKPLGWEMPFPVTVVSTPNEFLGAVKDSLLAQPTDLPENYVPASMRV